ncbi:Putative clathrin assembly protein At1g25240 [Linum perenne]
MKLWKRAAGALKDQNSILLATFLTPRTSNRNGTLEAAIIKATSHDGKKIDYRSAQRVFDWIRRSPVSLRPLVWGLTLRMERTHSWVVALKGLMLMHGILCCKTPLVLRIGRLPFDLSNFSDGHTIAAKMWGFNAFVRSYYTFLDQRTGLLYPSANKKCKTIKATIEEDDDLDHDLEVVKKVQLLVELEKLQKWQSLLDLLLQIKPLADNMKRNPLILEAMDCVTIEIFDLYSNICSGITRVLVTAANGKADSNCAAAALRVLQKARTQGKNLTLYFEFCRAFDVFNAMSSEVPKVTRIVPEEDDIKVLQHVANGVSELDEMVAKKGGDYYKSMSAVELGDNEGDRMVERETDSNVSSGRLQTVITDKWEVFDEDHNCHDQAGNYNNYGDQELPPLCDVRSSPTSSFNPFEMDYEDLLSFLPTPNYQPVYKQEEVPDLISF